MYWFGPKCFKLYIIQRLHFWPKIFPWLWLYMMHTKKVEAMKILAAVYAPLTPHGFNLNFLYFLTKHDRSKPFITDLDLVKSLIPKIKLGWFVFFLLNYERIGKTILHRSRINENNLHEGLLLRHWQENTANWIYLKQLFYAFCIYTPSHEQDLCKIDWASNFSLHFKNSSCHCQRASTNVGF